MKADIAKVLTKLGIAYRQQGIELHALCPAHVDRKPSWSINVHTGQHHCFSCGWGGGVAALVTRALGTDSLMWNGRDAWDWMRTNGLLVGDGELNMDVQLTLTRPERRPFIMPTVIGAGQLTLWPTPAARYVQQRGILGWQIKRWNVGVVVDGRLSGRIVFPVCDARATPISYSARTFTGAQPRYLTPHESERPDHAALFGEQFWPQHGQRDRLVVVEGAIKALAVERAVGWNVAGILGATQVRQPLIAAKLTTFREVIVLLDNDLAGDENADTLVASLMRHTNVRRARMPGKLAADDAPQSDLQRALA